MCICPRLSKYTAFNNHLPIEKCVYINTREFPVCGHCSGLWLTFLSASVTCHSLNVCAILQEHNELLSCLHQPASCSSWAMGYKVGDVNSLASYKFALCLHTCTLSLAWQNEEAVLVTSPNGRNSLITQSGSSAASRFGAFHCMLWKLYTYSFGQVTVHVSAALPSMGQVWQMRYDFISNMEVQNQFQTTFGCRNVSELVSGFQPWGTCNL